MEQYLHPFIQVTTSVFQDMLNEKIIHERAYFIKKEAFLDWDISGIIALTGEVKGLVAISMKSGTATKLADKLAGSDKLGAELDVTDAIGEIVNIIAGNVNKNLEDMFRIIISLPRVVRGKAHLIVIPDERTRMLCIPFQIFKSEIINLSINID
jgi:chemotaxis protein CheX